MAVTTTTTTPPTIVTIKEGDCVILPSNVIILSAFTFDDGPDIQSEDCPELAQEIADKLEFALEYCVKIANSNDDNIIGNIEKNYDKIFMQGLRINDVEYPFILDASVSGGFDALTYSSNSLIWQNVINTTTIGKSIKVISATLTSTTGITNNRGYQMTLKLKTFPSIAKDFTFYAIGSSNDGPQAPGTPIEFRVVECD